MKTLFFFFQMHRECTNYCYIDCSSCNFTNFLFMHFKQTLLPQYMIYNKKVNFCTCLFGLLLISITSPLMLSSGENGFLIHVDNFDFQNMSWNEKTTLFSACFAKIFLPEILIPQLTAYFSVLGFQMIWKVGQFDQNLCKHGEEVLTIIILFLFYKLISMKEVSRNITVCKLMLQNFSSKLVTYHGSPMLHS